MQLGEKSKVTFEDPNLRNLVAEVSIKEPITYGKGNKFKVAPNLARTPLVPHRALAVPIVRL